MSFMNAVKGGDPSKLLFIIIGIILVFGVVAEALPELFDSTADIEDALNGTVAGSADDKPFAGFFANDGIVSLVIVAAIVLATVGVFISKKRR